MVRLLAPLLVLALVGCGAERPADIRSQVERAAAGQMIRENPTQGGTPTYDASCARTGRRGVWSCEVFSDVYEGRVIVRRQGGKLYTRAWQ